MPEAGQIDPVADTATPTTDSTNRTHGRLWIVDLNGLVRPLEVTVGATDGTRTEVGGSDFKESVAQRDSWGGKSRRRGRAEERTAADGDKTSNPFLPRIPKGGQTAARADVASVLGSLRPA